MTTPIASYSVVTLNSSSPVSVTAETFYITDTGDIVFMTPNGQTAAAFAKGAWTEVLPAAST